MAAQSATPPDLKAALAARCKIEQRQEIDAMKHQPIDLTPMPQAGPTLQQQIDDLSSRVSALEDN